MILLFSIFAILVSVSSVNAASTVYVNATVGSDSNPGTSELPYLTIGKGIDSVDENGTVKIANGLYTGEGNTNIKIFKNVTITGQSQKSTIINGTIGNRLFFVKLGANVTIQNLTLTNGIGGWDSTIYTASKLTITNCTFIGNNGGTIINTGNCTVTGCTFTNNKAIDDSGGTINNIQGTLTVAGCTFTSNNGSTIINTGNCTVTGCTFTGNTGGTIINEGTITNLSNCIFTGNSADYGGATYNNGNINTLKNCTFKNNKASAGGAIYNKGTIHYLNDCTFISNTANSGGAINNEGNLTAKFNRFVNDIAATGSTIYNFDGSVNANYNWWGSNKCPSGKVKGCTVSKWLVLTVKANSITAGSLITADLLHDNTGVYHNPANGHIPNGIKVTYTTTIGTLKSPVYIVNGIAKSTLNRGSKKGTAYISVKVDSQTVQIPPKVVATSPKSGVTGISRTNTISIKLSENISKSVNWSKIVVKNLKTGSKCHIIAHVNGNHIYIKTNSKKTAYTWYQVYIPASAVKDSADNNLATSYTFRFKTGAH